MSYEYGLLPIITSPEEILVIVPPNPPIPPFPPPIVVTLPGEQILSAEGDIVYVWGIPKICDDDEKLIQDEEICVPAERL